MIVFPNCKINLGLAVKNKREDGYHNIETIFYPIPVKEALEILPSNRGTKPDDEEAEDAIPGSDVIFSSSGLHIDGDQADNLCIKGYHLLKKDFPKIAPCRIHLHKAIPMGAGLGGGSADGAFTLTALNEKYELGLTQAQLIQYALQLGSDCPFFILNKPCFATGRGEILEPFTLDLSAYQLILVNPGIHVNTGQAFAQLKASAITSNKDDSGSDLKSIISKSPGHWKETLRNDFETPVFEKHPEIKEIKNWFYANGAIYASMSGSGSSVYALLEKTVNIQTKMPAHYAIHRLLL